MVSVGRVVVVGLGRVVGVADAGASRVEGPAGAVVAARRRLRVFVDRAIGRCHGERVRASSSGSSLGLERQRRGEPGGGGRVGGRGRDRGGRRVVASGLGLHQGADGRLGQGRRPRSCWRWRAGLARHWLLLLVVLRLLRL